MQRTLATAAMLLIMSPAVADVIEVDYTGTVANYTRDSSGNIIAGSPVDIHGLFGGGNLAGQSFFTSWLFNVPGPTGSVSGGIPFGTTSPLISVNLTIAGHTQAFAPTTTYGVWNEGGYFDAAHHATGTSIYTNVTVTPGAYAMNNWVDSLSPSIPSDLTQFFTYQTNPAIDNIDNPRGIGGSFDFPQGLDGFLNIETVNVHAVPVAPMGSGLVGLLSLLLVGLRRMWQR